MRRDETILLDIAEAARLVTAFVHGMDLARFAQDRKTQSAVLYQSLVMGEAARRLSPEFRAAHPEIPWGPMTGVRNHLIHGYDLVDWDEVWKTATRDVADLTARLTPLLP